MRLQLLWFFTTLITLLGSSLAGEPKIMTPKDFVTSYEEALATQRWEKVDPLLHVNCTVTFSNGSCHQGKKEVQDAFQRNFDLIKDEEYAISDVHWVVKSETFAVFTYSYNWSGTINGEQVSGSGRGTSSIIFDGEVWKLVSEHLGPKS